MARKWKWDEEKTDEENELERDKYEAQREDAMEYRVELRREREQEERLIASAPALLAACEAALASTWFSSIGANSSDEADMLRAAIARAKGGAL